MLRAYRLPDGLYALVSDFPRETYNRREQIKRLGGTWDRESRQWLIPEAAMGPLRVRRMMMVVRDAFCHTPIEVIYVTEDDARAEIDPDAFCLRCDSHYGPVPILDNFGEPPECYAVRDELWPQMMRWQPDQETG